jgi:xanthosine utilization system XapX-like protein
MITILLSFIAGIIVGIAWAAYRLRNTAAGPVGGTVQGMVVALGGGGPGVRQ